MKNEIIKIAKQNSLIPHEKLGFLWDAVQNSSIGDIVEIGCYRGGSSLVLAYSADIYRSESKVFICDTFKGIALAGENDNYHKNGDFSDTSKKFVDNLLQTHGLINYKLIEGIFPDESKLLVTTNTISVLHIDVDVYEGYKKILEWAKDKLVTGAIIIFDDYGTNTCLGATKAVTEYFENRNDFDLHLIKDNSYKSSYVVYKGN